MFDENCSHLQYREGVLFCERFDAYQDKNGYTFAHLNRRFSQVMISQTSFAGLLNITKEVYQ
jgi:hypothetical protein